MYFKISKHKTRKEKKRQQSKLPNETFNLNTDITKKIRTTLLVLYAVGRSAHAYAYAYAHAHTHTQTDKMTELEEKHNVLYIEINV